jgi:flagellar hook protein FlgE
VIRALFSGVSGLNQNVVRLDVIGNNIANVNTVGYKTARVSFGDAFSQTLRGGSVARSNRGGVNPVQVGSGVRIHAITSVFGQGNIQTTGGDTDLAIQGQGFFVVNNGEKDFYSRDGSFVIDALGRLVQSGTGFLVQGFAYDPQTETFDAALGALEIPFDKTVPANATEAVTTQGNLPLDSEARSSIWQSTSYSDSTGATAGGGTLLTDLRVPAPAGQLLFAGDTITLTGEVSGTQITGATLAVGAATTVSDLLSFIDTEFGLPPGSSSVTNDGRIQVSGDIALGQEGAIGSISLTAEDAGGAPRSEFISVSSFDRTQDARDATEIVLESILYDSLGASHTLRMTYTRETGSLAWNWQAEIDGDASSIIAGGSGRLTYFSDGTLSSFGFNDGSAALTFDPGTGATSPQSVTLNFGSLADPSGMTLLAGNNSIESQQDGFPVGAFVDFAIDGSGRIYSLFSNGVTETVGDMALARFNNPTALIKDGDNLFTNSSNSGDPVTRRVSEMAGTSVIVGAVEQSNVDLAREFSEMIITQRAFQANARVIQTSSEVLGELMQLTR